MLTVIADWQLSFTWSLSKKVANKTMFKSITSKLDISEKTLHKIGISSV